MAGKTRTPRKPTLVLDNNTDAIIDDTNDVLLKITEQLEKCIQDLQGKEELIELLFTSMASLSSELTKLQKSVDEQEVAEGPSGARIISVEWSNRPAGLADVILYDGQGAMIRVANAEETSRDIQGELPNEVLSINPSHNGMEVKIRYKNCIFEGNGTVYATRKGQDAPPNPTSPGVFSRG